jgi:hypothetical protein
MPTAVETTTTIQDQLFQSIQTGQRAVVESVRQWSETVELIASRLPELAFSEPMKPSQVFEAGIGFTERLVSAQRDFTSQLLEAALPATRAPQAATQNTATQNTARQQPAGGSPTGPGAQPSKPGQAK